MKTTFSLEELQALPTIAFDHGWHLKVENQIGQIWINDKQIQYFRWTDSGLRNLDDDGNEFESL